MASPTPKACAKGVDKRGLAKGLSPEYEQVVGARLTYVRDDVVGGLALRLARAAV